MSYNTTLIFVHDWQKKFKGYAHIEASLALGGVAVGHFDDLLEKLRNFPGKDAIENEIKAVEEAKKEAYDSEGKYHSSILTLQKRHIIFTREESKKLSDIYCKLHAKLDRKILRIFWSGRGNENYTDDYGNLLMVTDLETLHKTIEMEHARLLVKEGQNYGQFDMALRMIEMFQHNFKPGSIKVVLWGD